LIFVGVASHIFIGFLQTKKKIQNAKFISHVLDSIGEFLVALLSVLFFILF